MSSPKVFPLFPTHQTIPSQPSLLPLHLHQASSSLLGQLLLWRQSVEGASCLYLWPIEMANQDMLDALSP
jgi:hypothetical protein